MAIARTIRINSYTHGRYVIDQNGSRFAYPVRITHDLFEFSASGELDRTVDVHVLELGKVMIDYCSSAKNIQQYDGDDEVSGIWWITIQAGV